MPCSQYLVLGTQRGRAVWLVDAQRASGGDAVVCGGALVRGCVGGGIAAVQH